MIRSRPLLLSVLVVAAACAQADLDEWTEAVPAQEVVRVTPPPDVEFGELTSLAALPDGGVVVFDTKNARGHALLEFDLDGRFVRVLGRHGRGPGEYATAFVGLAVAPDGTVLLRDKLQNRILRYRDGRSLSAIMLPDALASGASGQVLLALDDQSVILNGSFTWVEGARRPVFLRIDSTGTIRDSLVAREHWIAAGEETAYDVDESVTPLRTGGWLHVRGDRLGFQRRDSLGALELEAKREGIAPWYAPEERAELQRLERWLAAGRRFDPPERTVPARKPLVRTGFEDSDGRIWLVRRADAVRIPPEVKFFDPRGVMKVSWGEPVRLAGFDRRGNFLHEIIFPERARVAIHGDFGWAIVPDSLDVTTLIKYRITR